MEELIRARLKSQITGIPVDWVMSGQGFTAPRILLQRVSGGGDYDSAGPTGYRRARIQIDCYDVTPGAAKVLARRANTALSGYRSVPILGVFLQSERDLPADTEGAVTLGRVSLDFFVHYQEG